MGMLGEVLLVFTGDKWTRGIIICIVVGYNRGNMGYNSIAGRRL